VSSVKYELSFYIPEDAILHSHCRENVTSYMKGLEEERVCVKICLELAKCYRDFQTLKQAYGEDC
jgi:hypothetical protein